MKKYFIFAIIPPQVLVVVSGAQTLFQGFQRKSSLSCCLRTVVLHNSKAQEAHVLTVHAERKVLAPHGVEGVAVNGLGTEVAAVNGHAQNVHFQTGAACTVTRTNVLPGDNLGEKHSWLRLFLQGLLSEIKAFFIQSIKRA